MYADDATPCIAHQEVQIIHADFNLEASVENGMDDSTDLIYFDGILPPLESGSESDGEPEFDT